MRVCFAAVLALFLWAPAAIGQDLGASVICKPEGSDLYQIDLSQDAIDQVSILVKKLDPQILELTRLHIESRRIDKMQQLRAGQLTTLDASAIKKGYREQLGTYKNVVKTVGSGPFTPNECADGGSPVAITVEHGEDCKNNPSSCHSKTTHACNFGQRPYQACRKDGSVCQIWFEPDPICER